MQIAVDKIRFADRNNWKYLHITYFTYDLVYDKISILNQILTY